MRHHGLFCWHELSTTDADAAQAFYGDVFGWTISDSGTPGLDYRLIALPDGTQIGGLMGPFEGAPPPNWRGYVAVDDADATFEAATRAGATTHVPPSDIPGTGRFAVFSDPQGATVAILQPLPTSAARPETGETPGTVGWNELSATDIDAAWNFYQPLFDWRSGERHDMGAFGFYQRFGPSQSDRDFGGFAGPVEQSGWRYYFNVTALDAATAKIEAGGGSVAMVHQVPTGQWIAICTDPQGAGFALTAWQR